MAKKKQKEEIKEVQFQSPKEQDFDKLSITQKRIEDCEWVFQFDEDEPQVFAWTDPEIQKDEDPKVIFSISNIENSFISFKSSKNEKTFKIFAREISDEGKDMRNKQREAFKNMKFDTENFDQKMEEYGSENKEA